MIPSLLIANRGEIAWPFIGTLRAFAPLREPTILTRSRDDAKGKNGRFLPVVLNLFPDPCLEGGAGLDGAGLARPVRHGC
jgi:hypothetical protein